jgi:hypothetical protein
MKRVTIAGLIAALSLGTFALLASALVASAQTRPTFWPGTITAPGVPCEISPCPVLQEWYSDIPWHQKLGTFAGNEVDEAFVLPYAALPPQNVTYCTNSMGPQPTGPAGQTWQARCMIETGINNIVGVLRTDTLYNPMDPLITAARRCVPNFSVANPTPCPKTTVTYCPPNAADPLACIEVKLALSMFWTRSDDAANRTLTLDPMPFGTEPNGECPPPSPVPPNCIPRAYYGGYVITDGSTYVPQMPWYMSHYCDAQFLAGTADAQDAVCYGDYLSPDNDGFAPLPGASLNMWPNSSPWSVFPSAAAPAPNNHCPSGQTACTLVMAGFDLELVSSTQATIQYPVLNGNLINWFNNALTNFPTNFSIADLQRHFPWTGTQVTWAADLYPQAILNPFLGQFSFTVTVPADPPNCQVSLTGLVPANCTPVQVRADHYLYPRRCTLADLASLNAANLRECGLNYEIHHNGWLAQWPNSFWPDLNAASMAIPNQYGRTSFLFAGVPGMQLPVSFYKPTSTSYSSGLSVYEQVYNSSLFSLYIPIANEADVNMAFFSRNYTDDFYHTLLMSNHMESAPGDFAEGIRGKVLWHDEYRSKLMYAPANPKFSTVTFPASFNPATAPSPYHNHTCDGCHVRNGSGVPINTKLDQTTGLYMLDPMLQGLPGCVANITCFMTAEYSPYKAGKDYTFTGEIKPMKLVFFDLPPPGVTSTTSTTSIDDSVYSKPLASSATQVQYYSNKISNFYGDSFHVTTPGYNYTWYYGPANANRMVVSTPRINQELAITYVPQQVNLLDPSTGMGTFTTPFDAGSCPAGTLVKTPPGVPIAAWPQVCADITGTAIYNAIYGSVPHVGFMLLNGRRLGNSGAIEAIPNAAIKGFQQSQVTALGPTIAGEILWTAGTRGGVNGDVRLTCTPSNLMTCYIGRFGWLGDRVSLEDQVANAAFVEMNMTTKTGYQQLYGNASVPPSAAIRYNLPNCGPANQICVNSGGNSDLLEQDVERMADYARWLGSPTRSEFTVSLPDVIAGEGIFKQVKCNQCHVIDKIPITDPNDTMLTLVYRTRLATHVAPPAYPFLSYLGTDLLMHDMGYLSQVGVTSNLIRDQTTGVVFPQYKSYVQKIRTPALKGLRFNRFVTDSHNNTIPVPMTTPPTPPKPACDFLLHDGRACDAIEAAFLHDGPAIKALGTIQGLNGLNADQLRQLRAFLYSL